MGLKIAISGAVVFVVTFLLILGCAFCLEIAKRDRDDEKVARIVKYPKGLNVVLDVASLAIVVGALMAIWGL